MGVSRSFDSKIFLVSLAGFRSRVCWELGQKSCNEGSSFSSSKIKDSSLENDSIRVVSPNRCRSMHQHTRSSK
jgi:hypothetical protein